MLLQIETITFSFTVAFDSKYFFSYVTCGWTITSSKNITDISATVTFSLTVYSIVGIRTQRCTVHPTVTWHTS